MKILFKILIHSIIIGVVILGSFYTYVYFSKLKSKHLYEKIKHNPMVYVYDTTGCILNPAMYIKNLKYKDDFIQYYYNITKYYNNIEKGIIKPKIKIIAGDTLGYTVPVFITFPIKYMSYSNPVFFIRYLDKDSTIAEVVDFKVKCWGYIRGYVYYTNIHKKPPTDKILEEVNEDNRKTSDDDGLYEKPSEYGAQCWGCD